MLRQSEDEDYMYDERSKDPSPSKTSAAITNAAPSVTESLLLIPDEVISEQELLIQKKKSRVDRVIHHKMLLLDVRDPDAYSKCHIDGALLYEAPRLSRSVNALTPELLAFVCRLC